MLKWKATNNILDVVSTVGVPVFAGIFFVGWIVSLFYHPVINFPLIAIPIIVLYYFSSNIYSGILTGVTVVTGIVDAIFFIQKSEVSLILLECVAIVCLYLILEMYKNKYVSTKNRFFEEHDTLKWEITLKESAILENTKRIDNLHQRIKNLKKMGEIIQSFRGSLNEEELIHKSENIADEFMGKGFWKLKKYKNDDVFALYIKNTSLSLMITNIADDTRFPSEKNNDKSSVIAVPIEFNKTFWGILQGTSYIRNFFSEEDLRQLSLLAGIISTALNNFYLYEQLETLSITDGLTGLYTNIYFKERLKEELNRSQINKLPLSLCILDIDFFKDINDIYGHQMGDSVLRQISSILRLKLRETDFIARYGGEEFAIIMLYTNSSEAIKILEKIRLTIERESFFLPLGDLSSSQIKITASIGFVSLNKKNYISEEKFIQNADEALYKAKQLGRNRVEEYCYE
ncbi:MAG: sensor domain-containing diguanylate cyclase [Endomicrobium sp.]|jgi:diguanylate cyclase (GGDEF)-like protein|nr:sensor domain-containing diguanylate cyclase [Endomicrobium sp.]